MGKTILVTGGAGFIGSALIRFLLSHTEHSVVNLDKLTYAGNQLSLTTIEHLPNYTFIQGDICDRHLIENTLAEFEPDLIMHLAAESHVDRSIDGPAAFMQTNIIGTFCLLEASRLYYETLTPQKQLTFRFHHISTDEVYGDLGENDAAFTELSPYQPNSPYSASKAAADHLVRAWHRTYQLPVVLSNCSNNYGPYQFPEKLIPLVIFNAMKGLPLPVYGDGKQIRDWLHVDDHVQALYLVAQKGKMGETYIIGGNCERTNIDVVTFICEQLNQKIQHKPEQLDDFKQLIQFVPDRLGHDKRYAIDANKLKEQLGWLPSHDFESGLSSTIDWYLSHLDWCQQSLSLSKFSTKKTI